MSVLFDAGLRIAAGEANAPVLAAGTRRIVLRPDALVISIAAMPGQPDLLWTAGIAPPGATRPGDRAVAVAADPRHRGQHRDVWTMLGVEMRRRWTDGHVPQIVVSTPAVWNHLRWAARHCINDTDRSAAWAAAVVEWVAERSEHPGSQALIIATDTLSTHVAIDVDPADTWTVDTWLAAFKAGDPALSAVFDGDNDATINPDQDAVLERAVRKWGREDHGGHGNLAATASAPITNTLRQLVRRRHGRTAALAAIYQDLPIEPLAGLELFTADDADSWTRLRTHIDGGGRIALRDTFARAAVGLATREAAADRYTTVLLRGDSVEQARAITDGRVVAGVVTHADDTTLQVVTSQSAVRFKPGNKISTTGFADQVWTIDAMAVTVDGEIHLTLTGADGHLTGEEVTLIPPAPNLNQAKSRIVKVAQRCKAATWTHDPAQPAPASLDRPPLEAMS